MSVRTRCAWNIPSPGRTNREAFQGVQVKKEEKQARGPVERPVRSDGLVLAMVLWEEEQSSCEPRHCPLSFFFLFESRPNTLQVSYPDQPAHVRSLGIPIANMQTPALVGRWQ